MSTELGGIDLLGGGGEPAAASLLDGDLLGGSLLDSVGSGGGGLSGIFSAEPAASSGLGATLAPELASLPHERGTTTISNDPAISVTAAKVWGPETLTIVLFFENVGSGACQGVRVELEVPPQLTVSSGGATQFQLDLEPQGVAQRTLELRCSTIVSGTTIKGTCKHNRTGFFAVSVVAGDLVRPAASFTTAQFGAAWSAAKAQNQRSQKVSSARVKNAQGFIDAVSGALHLHPVQIIGSEAILAGYVMGSPDTLCLVHGKATLSGIDVLTRSSSAQCSAAVLAHCAAVCN